MSKLNMHRSITNDHYSTNFKSWGEMYPDDKVDIRKLLKRVRPSWKPFIKHIETVVCETTGQKLLDRINKLLSNCLQTIEDKNLLYPYPDLLFNFMMMTDLDKLKAVIIGQDPYFKHVVHKTRMAPQAMGLSFSVPYGQAIPSSLQSIFSNMLKFGHIKNKPSHGNLEMWAFQGCLMLNTSLTVIDNQINCHQKIWKKFTDELIKFISEYSDHVVFVLWGAEALSKSIMINLEKHDVTISSHPSGRSAAKPLRSYPAFNDFDTAGEVNRILKKWKKAPIMWQT
jgi:uracil-DNA glycosylase